MELDLQFQHAEWLREFYRQAFTRGPRYTVTAQRKRRRLARRGLRDFVETWQEPAPPTRQMRGVHTVMAKQCMDFETTKRAVGSI